MDIEKPFWDFERWSKIDVLSEPQHRNLICKALKDNCTGVEQADRTNFILYGPQEALLVKPATFSVRIGLFLYEAFLILIGKR